MAIVDLLDWLQRVPSILIYFALLLVALSGAIAADALIRLFGIGDFPLFARGGRSSYRMAANQRGCFRRRFDWRYDRHGMRTDANVSNLEGLTILLGDSVVDGGNTLDQRHTLAALASQCSGQTVYPVACHGWALCNELAALADMPGWMAARRLVWMVNTGDFDEICEGDNEFSFPTRRPLWLLSWLVRRYLYRANPRWWPMRRPSVVRTERPDLRQSALAAFALMAQRFSGEIIILRYPMRGQDVAHIAFYDILAEVRSGIRQIDIGRIPGWGADCYIDHIHPNAHGVALIAAQIAHVLAKEN